MMKRKTLHVTTHAPLPISLSNPLSLYLCVPLSPFSLDPCYNTFHTVIHIHTLLTLQQPTHKTTYNYLILFSFSTIVWKPLCAFSLYSCNISAMIFYIKTISLQCNHTRIILNNNTMLFQLVHYYY